MIALDQPLHSRSIHGIHSAPKATYSDIPMQGLYFVESTLPKEEQVDEKKVGPIVLFPGSWDAKQGEYSEKLICDLLRKCGAPAVLEAHYLYQDQAGYCDPDSFIKDLIAICLQSELPPTLVGLCFSCPFLLEALLVASEESANPSVAGAIVIGNVVHGYVNKLGMGILKSLTNKTMAAGSRHLSYNGHHHTSGNNIRGVEWSKESYLVSAMQAIDFNAPIHSFPIPVEALYFQLDFSTDEGRKRMRHIFGATELNGRIHGYHRTLRRRTVADELIQHFYLKTQERVLSM